MVERCVLVVLEAIQSAMFIDTVCDGLFTAVGTTYYCVVLLQ